MDTDNQLTDSTKGLLKNNLIDVFNRNNISVDNLEFNQLHDNGENARESKMALIVGVSSAAGFVIVIGLVILGIFTAIHCRRIKRSKEDEEREQNAEWEPQPLPGHQQMPFSDQRGLRWERRPSMSSSYNNWSIHNQRNREFDSPPSLHSAHYIARPHGLGIRPQDPSLDPYSRDSGRVDPTFSDRRYTQREQDQHSEASNDTPRTYFEEVTRHRIMPQIHRPNTESEDDSSSGVSGGSAGSTRSRSRRRVNSRDFSRENSPIYERHLPTQQADMDEDITAEAEEIIAGLYGDLEREEQIIPSGGPSAEPSLYRRDNTPDRNNNIEAMYAKVSKRSTNRRNDETGEGEEGDDDVRNIGRSSDLISDYSTTNNRIFNVRKNSNGSSGLGSMPSSHHSQNGGKALAPRRPRLQTGMDNDKLFRRQTSRTSSDQANSTDEALQLYYIDAIPEADVRTT